MIDKIKSYINAILGFAIVILGALLFNRNRKLQQAESELANEKAKEAVHDNDRDREAARQEADALVIDYERRKREYDESKLGGDGKL